MTKETRNLALAAGGIAVMGLGVNRRSSAGFACVLAGGGLFFYAAVIAAITARNRATGFDTVDEASWESFPASDPPAWT